MKSQILFKTTILTTLVVTLLLTSLSLVFADPFLMDIQHDTDEETHGVTSYAIGYYSGGNNYFHQELHRSVRVTEDPWTFTSYMYYGFRAIKTDFTVAYYDAYFVSAINYPQYFYITNVRQVLTYTECDFLNLDTLEPDNRQIWADVTYSGTPI